MERETHDMLLRAQRVLGNAIYTGRDCGYLIEDTECYPVVVLGEKDEIERSLEVLNAFFLGVGDYAVEVKENN
jgi:hypothetical protein